MTDRASLPLLLRLGLLAVALAAYAGIVFVRQGPPATGDTPPLTAVTTRLSEGDLHGAAAVVTLPDPPGYALLASPFVALFRPFIGAARWCTTASRVAASAHGVPRDARALFAEEQGQCGRRALRRDGQLGAPLPPWYHAQGVLGILAWLVLVAGAVALLRAAGALCWTAEVALVVFLVILPSASSAIVQLFHPQDLLSLGLSASGLALLLRRRAAGAGVLLGLAFLTKQFAVLILVPAAVAAPDRRIRVRLLVPAAAVTVAGLLPFLAADPRTTLQNLSGIGAAGAVSGTTVLSLLHASPDLTSAVARDVPVVFALAASWWARRRLGGSPFPPVALLGLVLACLASRLVFESVIFPYYLLAASVAFLVLDLVRGEVPDRSLAWIAASAAFVVLHPANTVLDAGGTLVLAATAVICGLTDVAGAARHRTRWAGAELPPAVDGTAAATTRE